MVNPFVKFLGLPSCFSSFFYQFIFPPSTVVKAYSCWLLDWQDQFQDYDGVVFQSDHTAVPSAIIVCPQSRIQTDWFYPDPHFVELYSRLKQVLWLFLYSGNICPPPKFLGEFLLLLSARLLSSLDLQLQQSKAISVVQGCTQVHSHARVSLPLDPSVASQKNGGLYPG